MRLRAVLLLSLALAAALPAAARAADVPPGATWTQATIPSTDGMKLHADVLRPKDLPADAEDAGHPLDRPVLQPLRARPGRPARSRARRTTRSARRRPVGALPRLRRRRRADGARLHVRDGRPARLRRLERLPGLGRARASSPTSRPPSSGRRRSRGRPARSACTASPTTRVTGLIGVDQQPAGPRRRRLPGAGLRPLPLPVRERGALRELARARRRSTTRSPPRRARSRDDPNYNVNGVDDTERPGCLAAELRSTRQPTTTTTRPTGRRAT